MKFNKLTIAHNKVGYQWMKTWDIANELDLGKYVSEAVVEVDLRRFGQ